RSRRTRRLVDPAGAGAALRRRRRRPRLGRLATYAHGSIAQLRILRARPRLGLRGRLAVARTHRSPTDGSGGRIVIVKDRAAARGAQRCNVPLETLRDFSGKPVSATGTDLATVGGVQKGYLLAVAALVAHLLCGTARADLLTPLSDDGPPKMKKPHRG